MWGDPVLPESAARSDNSRDLKLVLNRANGDQIGVGSHLYADQ
jgi:hypothetical protein